MLWLILSSTILHCVLLINANGLYSVVAPKTLRSNSAYKVVVAIHDAPRPTEVSVSLTGPSFNLRKYVDVPSMSSKTVRFDIPKLTRGEYELKVLGSGGIEFQNSTKLGFEPDLNWLYIQSDKATYKPGDKIQFRVLFLDKHTRPAVIDKPIQIEIHDGAQNLIKSWKDIKPTGGVYSGELQLSDRPVLGNWTLTAAVQDEGNVTNVLVVDKYVVPKFEVLILTAKDVAASAGYIRATIKARYTFKKPVKGHIVASIEGSSTEKSLPIDGEVNVEFPISATAKRLLKITAIVTEELTDLKHNGTAYVTVHQHRHKQEDLLWPTNYRPGVLYEFKTVVRNLDGSPVMDSSKMVNFNVLCCQSYRNFSASLQNSIATQHIMLPDSTCKSCLVTSTFETAAKLERYIYKIDKKLMISIITKKPQLRKELKINVVSDTYLPYFIITIFARGNIVMSQFISLEGRKKSQEIAFEPAFVMVPQATIFVHYIFDGVLISDEKTVDIERDFENTIEISTTNEARPRDEVSLKVKTDPHSFVGLLGVDQSVLLLRSGNDLNRDQILNNLATYSTDLVTLTNANINIYRTSGGCYTNPGKTNCTGNFFSRTVFKDESAKNSGPVPTLGSTTAQGSLPPVRKLFPETWLFSNINDVGANGEYIIRKTVPDTLTSWVITGFSLSPQSGLAVTRSPSRIRVFQPFFITTNLPYSVKRGEVIAIPVVVFNYLGMDVRAKVSMDNSDGQYEFIETTYANMSQYHLGVQREKTLWIPANTGRGISFMIRPKKVGLTTLKITAISSYAGDRLHQILKVEADGVQKYVNKAVLINVQRLKRRSLAPPEKSLFIEKVDEAIEGSEFFEFEVFGTSQAPQLEHLDDLVHLPYGCGEQNMFNFVPSILALSYLKETNRQDQEIENNAKSYVETGYQRELNYKLNDGSFSAWGQSDPSGSTWLTAYVIRSFHQAAKYIDIDKNVLVAGLDFLVSRQGTDGEFRELGRVIHNSHGSPLALTSFVLLTFFENKEYMHKYQNVIDKAVAFVDTKVRQSNEPYDLAIVALALSLADKRKANIVLDKLERLASRQGDHKWWTGSDKSKSSDVEITSYVLLALLEHLEQHKSNEHRPIVDWLISKRNSNGGFVSSQDTVVGIMALTKFELQSHESTDSLNIDYWLSIEDKKHVTITKETELNVQTHTLPENGNNLKFLATGQGHAQVQLSYRYNVATKEASPSFKLTTTVKKSDKSRLILGICGEYTPIAASDGNKPTNMALMQVQLPSGYVCDTDSFAAIEAISDVKRVETKNEDTEVHIYFEKLLPGDRKCLTLKAIYTHAVANLKPSWIRLYDYYATERTATEFYHVDTSLCDICHGDECGSGC
ncbi:C3 and PZP-like alpha-2-macroglobulin domain-containing protein 8 [Drosophila mauritiana]|uniref:TEP1-F n=1 Tax=Drosophila mauritiana TaxID=7226 RepID=A0A6P8L3Q6_DROMA|nr:C3 and PZP-like alpha-2-macroglobulin domain-containing protein 8 [Drosophila mauritiana]